MERKPEHIDQLFKQRLYDAAPPPPAFVWDAVERRLHKRRRRFLFWIFAFGIAGVFAAAVWYFTQKQTGEPVYLTTELPTPAAGTTPGTTMPPSPAAEAVTPANTPVAIQSASETTFKTTPSTPVKRNTTTKNAGHSAADPIQSPVLTGVPSINTDIRSETPDAEPQVTVQGAEGKEVSYSLAFLPLERQAGLLSEKQPAQPSLFQIKVAKRKAKKTVKKCYDFAKDPTVWMIEAYSGPSLTQKILASSPDNQPYLNKRLHSEHNDLAFNAGVNAALMLRGNLLLKTGLQYEQFTEVFEHIDPEYVKYLVEIENDGGVITIDTIGVEYGEKYLKTYNRFKMLDIPLSVGFELRNRRSGFNINAGVSVNLLFRQRGAMLSPDTGEPAWFTSGLKNTPDKPAMEVFKTSTGLSAFASVQWFYHLKPRLRLYAEPYFRKVLDPVNLSNHPVQQRYGIGGLKLGVAAIL